ncbi:MAG: hypothetical protein WCF77_03370 [Minisyncoccia bacterium]|jgi:predicted small integral membrane protein
MKKKMMGWAVWLVGAIMACAVLLFAGRLSWEMRTKLPEPRPDIIATSTTSDETVLIENRTAGYVIAVPQDWYLEKSAGSGLSVYPDYDATGKVPPDCKIEISVLANPDREDPAGWLTGYFHEDPTADVSEIARTTTTVDGAPGIIWKGVLNDVPATLAYIATGTKVYEIAPETIAGAEGDCQNAFKSVLETFHFTK